MPRATHLISESSIRSALPSAARGTPAQAVAHLFAFGKKMRALLAIIIVSHAFAAELIPQERTAVISREKALGFVHAVCLAVPEGVTEFGRRRRPTFTALRTRFRRFFRKWIRNLRHGFQPVKAAYRVGRGCGDK
jgi:hypothetical protein